MDSWCYLMWDLVSNNSNRTNSNWGYSSGVEHLTAEQTAAMTKQQKHSINKRTSTLQGPVDISRGENSEDLAWVCRLGYKAFVPGTRIQLSRPFPTYQALLLSHKSWLWASSPEKVTSCFSQALRDALVTPMVARHFLRPYPASWASLDSN